MAAWPRLSAMKALYGGVETTALCVVLMGCGKDPPLCVKVTKHKQKKKSNIFVCLERVCCLLQHQPLISTD